MLALCCPLFRAQRWSLNRTASPTFTPTVHLSTTPTIVPLQSSESHRQPFFRNSRELWAESCLNNGVWVCCMASCCLYRLDFKFRGKPLLQLPRISGCTMCCVMTSDVLRHCVTRTGNCVTVYLLLLRTGRVAIKYVINHDHTLLARLASKEFGVVFKRNCDWFIS